MTSERFEADYLIECPCDPRSAAEVMAGEQSSGTFVAVPGETPELKASTAARIEVLSLLGTVAAPTLTGGGIFAHPDGPAAGVASLQAAWEGALAGIPATTYAEHHPTLMRALESRT
jgi:ribulose-bisphosphate carboxylase large chain